MPYTMEPPPRPAPPDTVGAAGGRAISGTGVCAGSGLNKNPSEFALTARRTSWLGLYGRGNGRRERKGTAILLALRVRKLLPH